MKYAGLTAQHDNQHRDDDRGQRQPRSDHAATGVAGSQ
jgi:hypothetical protein